MQIGDFSASVMNAQVEAKSRVKDKSDAQAIKEAKEDAKLKKACEGFESMFMNMMYKEMRKTVPKSGFWGNSNAEDLWQDMMDSEMVDQMAKSGGIGLADMLYNQLKRDFQDKMDMELRAQQANEARMKALNIKV